MHLLQSQKKKKEEELNTGPIKKQKYQSTSPNAKYTKISWFLIFRSVSKASK